jgi:hypothetical protein
MGDLLGVISTVVGGGATGVVGIGLQLWDAKNKRDHELAESKNKRDHERAMLDAQNENSRVLRQMDIDNAAKLATISADSAQTLAMIDADNRALAADSANLQASMAADKPMYLDSEAQRGSKVFAFFMAIIDLMRGLIRPSATIYGLVLLTLLMYWMMDLHAQKTLVLTPEDAKAIANKIIDAALFIPSLTVTWWFGSRYIAKGGK